MEEEDKTLEVGGEAKIKTQVPTEIKIMHVMLNARVSRVITQMNVQHKGDQITKVEGEGNKIVMLQQTKLVMMMIGPNNYLSCSIW